MVVDVVAVLVFFFFLVFVLVVVLSPPPPPPVVDKDFLFSFALTRCFDGGGGTHSTSSSEEDDTRSMVAISIRCVVQRSPKMIVETICLDFKSRCRRDRFGVLDVVESRKDRRGLCYR